MKDNTGDSPGNAPSALPISNRELPIEDPLEALLDSESDEQFGEIANFDQTSDSPRVKLADWTARDFSSIYVRFRPHLERHARRFLNNQTQVDEVVQDAFLYLMVSLPELDSEVGVLRFLKWKTRLLALDVIRLSQRVYLTSIDDVAEPASDDIEAQTLMERQDDAAVVKLALAKLHPRHREVLIASMYEEKSTEQIANQVGLSENATRQLLFRARSAFKKALIGDVDTTGMSAGAILSVAARKAAKEGKKIGASAMALIALVVMSVVVYPTFNRTPADQLAETSDQSNSQVDPTSPQPIVDEPTLAPSAEPSIDPSAPSAEPAPANTPVPNQTPGVASPTPSVSKVPASLSREEVALSDDVALQSIFEATNSVAEVIEVGESFFAYSPEVALASFNFDREERNNKFSQIELEFNIGGVLFRATPNETREISFIDPQGRQRHVLFATLSYLYDSKGKVWSESDLAKATVRLELLMDSESIFFESATLSVLN